MELQELSVLAAKEAGEVALTEPRTATFTDSGAVRVPIRAIADRWITYYWPLYTSPVFLPQMNGEHAARGHLLAFWQELGRLIAEYHQVGDLSAFTTDRRSGALLPTAQAVYGALIQKLQHAIRVGPVTYAGGSLPERLFGYDRGDVLVAAPLWRELSLMGHGIQEALLLRWAELVSQLSLGEVTPGDVVVRLLVRPNPERETAAARQVYLAQANLACVWTGRTIPMGRLAVDHVIPYALWRNNDLWNLLPSHAEVNGRKGDLLPARELLDARRSAIMGNWKLTHATFPHRFEAEADAQTGRYGTDLDRLFDALLESVETTALQRACPRWVP